MWRGKRLGRWGRFWKRYGGFDIVIINILDNLIVVR